LIATDAGLRAIECNPRLTSGIHCFRGQPRVAAALIAPDDWPSAQMLRALPGQRFRSTLGLIFTGQWCRDASDLTSAHDDPWPRRLELVTWLPLLMRSATNGMNLRRTSTADIEWNGEP
jgi:hypothetical protein